MLLIEHFAGKFPVWLSPEQVRLVTVNQDKKIVDFAQKIANQAKELGVRLTIDDSNESVGKKIRSSELMKIPYTVVIGEKEIESNELGVRIRKDLVVVQSELRTFTADELLKTVVNESKSRTNKTSL